MCDLWRDSEKMKRSFLLRFIGVLVGVLAVSAGCSSGYGSAPVQSGDVSESPEEDANTSASDNGDLEVVDSGHTVVNEHEGSDGIMYISVSYGVILQNTSDTDWVTVGNLSLEWLDSGGDWIPRGGGPEDFAAGFVSLVELVPPGGETALAGYEVLAEVPDRVDLEPDVEWLPESDLDDVGEMTAEVSDVVYDEEDDEGNEAVRVDFRVNSSYAVDMENVRVFSVLRDADDEIIGGAGYRYANQPESFTFSEGDNAASFTFEADSIPDDQDVEFELYCFNVYHAG